MNTHAMEEGPARQLHELTEEECLARLATEQVGRLAVVVGHYPQVFCVNYRVADRTVVLRTHPGTMLFAAEHAKVGFEVDHLDLLARRGWSVLVQGVAEDVTDEAGEARGAPEPRPWTGRQPRLVRITPVRITGRELLPDEVVWATDSRGYI